MREFHRWWPLFRVAVMHNSGTFEGHGAIGDVIAHAGAGNVLVTTYAHLRSAKASLMRHAWHYVVLDEGHRIRNPDAAVTLAAKQLNTEHRIILSGSPVQNNLRELWSLFDFISPGRLGDLPTFEADLHLPIKSGSFVNATPLQVETAYKCACVLRDTIKPFLIHRIKDDVMEQIQLPPRDEQVRRASPLLLCALILRSLVQCSPWTVFHAPCLLLLPRPISLLAVCALCSDVPQGPLLQTHRGAGEHLPLLSAVAHG